MKTSLDPLPPRKQRQPAALVDEIRQAVADDPVGGYFSDYDVLVVAKSPKSVEKQDAWSRVDARCSTTYAVTEDELGVMAERVRDLRGRVERVCRERIEGAG